MPTFHRLYKIDWIEYERGWGQRPDGTTLHKSLKDAESYIKEFELRQYELNLIGTVPDNYTKPNKPASIVVPKDVFDYVNSLEINKYWISPTSWWDINKPYKLPEEEKEIEVKPKSVDEMSIEELQYIIDKKILSEKAKQIPQRKSEDLFDLKPLTNLVEKIIEDKVADPDYEDDDNKQYIFETVMEMYYGKDIWKWWNSL